MNFGIDQIVEYPKTNLTILMITVKQKLFPKRGPKIVIDANLRLQRMTDKQYYNSITGKRGFRCKICITDISVFLFPPIDMN